MDGNRRRSTVRWTSSEDEGRAVEAIAEIETWLEARAPAPDWAGMLGGLRDALQRIAAEPAVARDPEAWAILAEIAASAEDADALDRALAALLHRVAVLLPATPAPGDPPEADRETRSPTWSPRAFLRL